MVNKDIIIDPKRYDKAKSWINEIDSHPDWGHAEINWEAIDQLKELLRLATPDMPQLEGDGYANGYMVYDIWICPNCGKEYEIEYDGKHNVCPNCGQTIDWRGNE